MLPLCNIQEGPRKEAKNKGKTSVPREMDCGPGLDLEDLMVYTYPFRMIASWLLRGLLTQPQDLLEEKCVGGGGCETSRKKGKK